MLQDYAPEPLPVHFLYPHSRFRSPTIRAFADLCVKRLAGCDQLTDEIAHRRFAPYASFLSVIITRTGPGPGTWILR